MLSIYRAGEIDLFENLDIVHIRLLVVVSVDVKQHLEHIVRIDGPTENWSTLLTGIASHQGEAGFLGALGATTARGV